MTHNILKSLAALALGAMLLVSCSKEEPNEGSVNPTHGGTADGWPAKKISRIVIEGADGETVHIFDMMGRTIHNEALPIGVYMVKVGDRPARKVAVIR